MCGGAPPHRSARTTRSGLRPILAAGVNLKRVRGIDSIVVIGEQSGDPGMYLGFAAADGGVLLPVSVVDYYEVSLLSRVVTQPLVVQQTSGLLEAETQLGGPKDS